MHESVASETSQRGSRSRIDAAILFAAIGIAWLFIILAPGGMGMGPVAFLLAWTVMMAAMMLPSAAPLVLLYRRGASAGNTALLITGYLSIWALAGVPTYLAFEFMPMTMSPIALAVAGIYQLTPAKTACLRQCRSPADFLVLRWGRGPLRLGIEHGAWCLGCCWALMLVLVVVGMMGLVWVVGLATLVAIEKLSARGVMVSRLAGAAFLAAAIFEGIR